MKTLRRLLLSDRKRKGKKNKDSKCKKDPTEGREQGNENLSPNVRQTKSSNRVPVEGESLVANPLSHHSNSLHSSHNVVQLQGLDMSIVADDNSIMNGLSFFEDDDDKHQDEGRVSDEGTEEEQKDYFSITAESLAGQSHSSMLVRSRHGTVQQGIPLSIDIPKDMVDTLVVPSAAPISTNLNSQEPYQRENFLSSQPDQDSNDESYDKVQEFPSNLYMTNTYQDFNARRHSRRVSMFTRPGQDGDDNHAVVPELNAALRDNSRRVSMYTAGKEVIKSGVPLSVSINKNETSPNEEEEEDNDTASEFTMEDFAFDTKSCKDSVFTKSTESKSTFSGYSNDAIELKQRKRELERKIEEIQKKLGETIDQIQERLGDVVELKRPSIPCS